MRKGLKYKRILGSLSKKVDQKTRDHNYIAFKNNFLFENRTSA